MPSRLTPQKPLIISSLQQPVTANPVTGRSLRTTPVAQIAADPTDNRFAFAIYRPVLGRDAYVSIRFMTISGETDQSAGVFVRFTSVDDYYVARASVLENNVGLYRVVAGKRQMIGCMEVNVPGQEWHTLGIAARDERLTVFFDDRELFVAVDRKFPGPPGRVASANLGGRLTAASPAPR